jgi:gluconolactonase
MYGIPAPQLIRAEIVAVLPERYRKQAEGPRSALRQSSGGTTLEGPSFDRAGNLYFTDLHNSRIFRMNADCSIDLVAEYQGGPNGLKIHQDGRIFVADREHGLMLLDPASGGMTLLLGGTERERFKGINDLVFASNGDLYFTDQGATGLHDPTGRVYRLRADGELSVVLDNVPSPNGITLHANEQMLYVAVTRANAVWNAPLSRNGGATRVGLFAQLPCAGPDGMAMDVEGNLAVASPGYGVVWVHDRFGLPTHRVETVEGRAEMPASGRPMYSHM